MKKHSLFLQCLKKLLAVYGIKSKFFECNHLQIFYGSSFVFVLMNEPLVFRVWSPSWISYKFEFMSHSPP